MADLSLPAGAAPGRELSWRTWVPSVALFQLVYLVAFIDRQVISLLVTPLKQSLGLSDVQIGLLQGFAFTLVLSLSSLLTARMVDKGNRVHLLSGCMLLWCTMTVASGFAGDFWMLLLCRMGLAIAEAIVPVVVMSIICDITPRSSIPRAGALFLMASYIGSGMALLFGGPLLGWLGAHDGTAFMGFERFEAWRGVFIIVGAPGSLIALGMGILFKEPERLPTVAVLRGGQSVLAFLRTHKAFILTYMTLIAGANLINITNYAWVPTYLIRVHGLTAAEAGLSAGAVFVAAGIGGCLFGAWLMGRTTPERALRHVVGIMHRIILLLAVPLVLMALVPGPWMTLALLALSVFLLAIILSSALTPLQLFAPADVRGRVSAVAIVYSAALSGIGPLMVGMITDLGFQQIDRIGYSLAITYAGSVLVAAIAAGAAAAMARRIEEAASSSVS